MEYFLVILCALLGAILEGLAQWWVSDTAFDRGKFYNSIRRSVITALSLAWTAGVTDNPAIYAIVFLSAAGISVGINKVKDNL